MFEGTNPMSHKTIILAALAAAAISSGAAQAARPDPDTLTVRVSLADLNLAGEPDAAIALRRINAAAKSICGDQPAIVELGRMALHSACMRSTVGRAVATLNSPVVTALYTGARGSSALASR
jgi:UrcA family protein